MEKNSASQARWKVLMGMIGPKPFSPINTTREHIGRSIFQNWS